MRQVLLPLLIGASFACQKINYDAVSGVQNGAGGQAGAVVPPPSGGSGGGAPGGYGGSSGAGGGNPGAGGAAPMADAGPSGAGGMPGARPARCEMVTAQAYRIVRDNCSFCHQNAGQLGGAFTFILDLPMLINRASPTGLSKPLLVPGDPNGSLIYFRLDTNQMPPADRVPRPDRERDLPILHDFIGNCIAGGPPYKGWPLITEQPDAGPVNTDPPCQAGNKCDNGGCCVFGLCRKPGAVCGMSATGDLVPGICMNGSCVDGAKRCGSLTEACCPPLGKCTATGASCGPRTAKCEPCGGAGQWCCDYGGLCSNAHLSCIGGGGGGNPATCEPCGAPGQACCGEGVAADKKCDDGGKCVRIPGVGPGKGDICPGGPDAGAPTSR